MAQLALAAAFSVGASAAATGMGVAASATFMGTTAGGWGWMVGSMIGGMLLGGGDSEGPRIEDKRLSTSVYGQPIPWVYGTARVGTQIIWASELIESSREVGGKGGGDSVTMYDYAANFLVSVCEAPAEPLRIWANGRLIWTADGGSGIVDEEIIQRGNVRILRGEETQSPDPVYETAVGADVAPAHRGYLTIMFEGMALQFSGNRLPSIEVEVATNVEVLGCEGDIFDTMEPAGPQMWSGNDVLYGDGLSATAYDAETGNFFALSGTEAGGSFGGAKNTLEVYSAAGSTDLSLRYSIALPTRGNTAGMAIDPENRLLWVLVGNPAPGADGGPVAAIVNLDTLAVTYSHARLMNYLGDSGGCGTDESGFWCCSPLLYSWFDGTSGNDEGGTGAKNGAMIHIFPGNGGEIAWSRHGGVSPPLLDFGLANGDATHRSVAGWPLCSIIENLGEARGIYWITSVGTGYTAAVLYVPISTEWQGGINYRILYGEGGRIERVEQSGATTVAEGPGGSDFGRLVFSAERKRVYAFYGNANVASIDLSEDGDPNALDTAWAELSELTDLGGADTLTWSEYHDGLLVMRSNVFGIKIGILDPDTGDWIIEPCEYDSSEWPAFLVHGRITGIREVGQGWFVGITQYSNLLVKFRAPGARVNGGPVILGDIVEDLCVRSGLLAGEVDVSTLTDLVDGFKVGRRASARASIDELRSAWPFDAVTSGDVLRFVKRGGNPVMTIDADDLGTRVWSGSSEPEPALEIERAARDEVPRELSLSYIDASADYDPGVATARRQAGGAPVIATQELPIVMTAEYAGRVAWYNLLAQHAARDTLRFKLPYLYEPLEPTDAVWMPDDDGRLRRVLITNKVNARPLLECEGVFEDASIYGVLLGTPGREQGPQQDTPRPLSRVVLAILDLPPLRDVDDTLLLYVAAAPADGGAWSGASLYRSSDGVAFAPAATFAAAATLGTATSALADWTGGNVFDDASTVTVRLDNGTLQSVTELALLNGANAAALGSEIIQFQTAELIGEREWRLSKLLRGRKGTERGQSTHAIGDRFVLLDTGALQLLPYDYVDVGATRYYKLAAPGAELSSVLAESHVAQGNSVKPLAPVWIAGTRDADDLTITWVRRARINAEWRDVIDVPLDEPSESYQVDILDGLTVVRTLSSATPTATYTAAQQTADFGTPQSSVSVAVYQISSRLGRGHAGTATL